MKKLLVLSLVSLVAASAFPQSPVQVTPPPAQGTNPAQVAPPSAQAAKPRRVSKEAAKKFMDRLGGFVTRPDLKPGKVYFVNAQKRVPNDALTNVTARINKTLHTNFKVIDGAPVTPKTASAEMRRLGAAAVIFVVECGECEMPSVVAPESRWAIVNVGALAADGAEPQFVEARTRKQLMRTFAALFGSTCSNYNCDLLLPYRDVKELDKIVTELPPMDVMVHARKYLDAIDVETRGRATYVMACKEGWAPAPTNEYQKAIWDKYNAKPANPIRIKPGDKPRK